MGIDKDTKPNSMNIVMPDTKEFIKILREQAEADGQHDCLEEGEPKKLSLTDDRFRFIPEEYYFEDGSITDGKPELTFSGSMEGGDAKVYVYFSLPLSDIVLLDILQHSIKRLNKLRTALETLK